MNCPRLVRLSLLVGALALTAFAAAAPIDRIVKIQPILAARSDGTNVRPDLSYAPYLNKIWAQAGIGFEFLPPVQLNDNAYYTLNYNNAYSLVTAPGKGQSADPLVVNCFFVNQVTNASVYGFGYFDQPYAVMDTSLIAGYSTLGRVDTFAHELGHVLNLNHTDAAYPTTPGVANYLLASGPIRNVPQSLGNVAPDGTNLDRLLPAEIAIARNSKFAQPIAAVPEPATLAALGLGAAAMLRRRRRA